MLGRKNNRDLLAGQLDDYDPVVVEERRRKVDERRRKVNERFRRAMAPEGVWPLASKLFLIVVLVAMATDWVIGAMGFDVTDSFREALVTRVCELTGCSNTGMALAAWAVPLTLVIYAVGLAVRWERASRAGKVAWTVAGVVLLVALGCLSTDNSGPGSAGVLQGPGAAAAEKGLLWGLGSLGVAVVVLIALQLADIWWKVQFWAGNLLLVLSLGAVAWWLHTDLRHENKLLFTTLIFPDVTVRMDHDVLTRTSATDLVGCGDLHPGCLRTAEFDFTTDDSDALVRFQVITFPDSAQAWRARAELGASTEPASIRETGVVNQWLTIATVRHADGRAIASGEEKWLRWPARQLDFVWADAVGYSHGRDAPEASETAAPRTP